MRSEVLEFRFISVADEPDGKRFNDGLAWSRAYEYPLAFRCLRSAGARRIHNTSWGFEGIHVTFKEALDGEFEATHSDLRPSLLPRTAVYDITKAPPSGLGEFDAILSISVLEEVACDPVIVLGNLMAQVRVGGLLFVSFDVPGVDLPRLEAFAGRAIDDRRERLCGANSIVPNELYRDLNAGVLVMRRVV